MSSGCTVHVCRAVVLAELLKHYCVTVAINKQTGNHMTDRIFAALNEVLGSDGRGLKITVAKRQMELTQTVGLSIMFN